MRILYLGDDTRGTTSLHRAHALQRLGHHVSLVNPQRCLRHGVMLDRLHYRSGYRLSRGVVEKRLGELLGNTTFDLAWVGGGREVSADAVHRLRSRCARVVNYNNDDPLGGNDAHLWDTWLDAVPAYDLVVVLRDVNVPEAFDRGAQRVLRVWMSFDEKIHRPRVLTRRQQEHWKSDVLFVGTWTPDRGRLLRLLIEAGTPLTIYGDRWNRAPEWDILRKYWRGGFLRDHAYAHAIQCAKICLGLLSKSNRDLHTRRSAEVPALGSLLLAERTSEHVAIFGEDEGAALWSSPEECIEKASALLRDDNLRQALASEGRRRVLERGLSNEQVVRQVLSAADE